MTTVAILGTGTMGAGMARSLQRAGITTRVWNRTLAKAEPLAAEGITVLVDAAEAVKDADVVITMLSDGAAVLSSMAAAAPGLRAGQIWLQTSTVGIEPTTELASLAERHQLRLIDAPVIGTRQPAENGQLLVLAAGDRQALADATPVLDAVAARTIPLGDNAEAATASRLKLVVNSWVLATTVATAEAIALAEGLGLDTTAFAALVQGSAVDSPYLQVKANAIAAGDFTPNFGLDMAAKDAVLIADAAEAVGVRTDVIDAVAARLRRSVEDGLGEKDVSATYLSSTHAEAITASVGTSVTPR
ncbi:NAD(P)-dependent oxidoreductase [Nocardia heshunensis]